MADRPATVHVPAGPVYRIGRSPDPFAAPDWVYAQPDGTFGGRFDDPSGRRGVPANQRFRVLYFATEPVDAFAEVLAHF
ncbi:MAG: RES domain-containing protein, partial [Chloroflexota bacterium]